METIGRTSRVLHVDGPLLMALLAVSATGLVALYSASGEDAATVLRQAGRIGLGLVVMFAVARVPSAFLKRAAPWLFAVGLGMLFAVLAYGDEGKGAQRWLDLGFIRFQPSEIMKIAVPMAVAWLCAGRPLPVGFGRAVLAAVLILVPVALIEQQPDLGTAFLVGAAGLFALFLAGLRWRIMLGLGLAATAMTPLLWRSLHEYQRQRIRTFLDPEQDPLGAGYHIIQSKIAIGSGGLFGKGWLNGTQSQLEFLPERSTDFIFSVFAEEFGLFGVLTLLVAYLFIVGRGLWIAVNAQDTFSRLLAGTVTLTFFVYVFVNAGMVSGLLPVVGVPLPMFSYGGTAVVTLFAGFGILMSIHSHRKLISY